MQYKFIELFSSIKLILKKAEVDDEIENKQLVKLERNLGAKNTLAIDWALTNKCSYRCSYCPKKLHSGDIPVIDYSAIKVFCEKLCEHYAKLNKQIYVNISGGEPTTHKDFLQIVELFKKMEMKVGLISNGSAPIKFWKEVEAKLDRLHLSYHSESAKIDHFMEVITIFHDKINVHINVMMYPDNFDKCFEVAKMLANTFPSITISLAKLYVNIGNIPYHYSQEQLKILDTADIRSFSDVKKLVITSEKRNDELSRNDMLGTYDDGSAKNLYGALLANNRLNKWKNWLCYAGIENLAVEFNGNYYRGWCRQSGKLGNVGDKEPSFPTTPIVCRKNSCDCIFDMLCTKKKHHVEKN